MSEEITFSKEDVEHLENAIKRLEQERDFWCKKSGELEDFVDKQVKDIDRLEQENKELKKKYIDKDATCSQYQYCLQIEEQKNSKLKQTLEEIRKMLKIAEKAKSADKHFEYMDNALNKCNEVLK